MDADTSRQGTPSRTKSDPNFRTKSDLLDEIRPPKRKTPSRTNGKAWNKTSEELTTSASKIRNFPLKSLKFGSKKNFLIVRHLQKKIFGTRAGRWAIPPPNTPPKIAIFLGWVGGGGMAGEIRLGNRVALMPFLACFPCL